VVPVAKRKHLISASLQLCGDCSVITGTNVTLQETRMHLRTLNLIAVAALALPLASQAEKLSYSYVDVAHFPSAKLDHHDFNVDGDGLQLRGSLPVHQNFFGFAEFQSLNLDDNVDVRRFLIGGGGHWPINNKIDIVGRLGIVNYKVDTRNFDDDDTGIFIGARVRAIVMPKLELEGGVEHQQVEVFGLKNDTYLVGEARYNFTPQWSAGAIVNVGGDTNLIGAQGRFSF
jgi:hypothetical protein